MQEWCQEIAKEKESQSTQTLSQWGRGEELKTGGECIPLSTLLILAKAR